MRWLPFLPSEGPASVSDLTDAIRNVRQALTLLEIELVDSEPAPLSVVLVQDRSSGRVHRRGRVEGIPGLMAFEGDNSDEAGAFDIIPDLSRISDEAMLCTRCFGPVDDPREHE